MRRVRRKLQHHIETFRACILTHFPTGTKVTRPDGGLFVWIELPPEFNSDVLYRKAVQAGILFAPGSFFTIKGTYSHHLRLSAGTWNGRIEKAITEFGRLCAKMKGARNPDSVDRVETVQSISLT